MNMSDDKIIYSCKDIKECVKKMEEILPKIKGYDSEDEYNEIFDEVLKKY